MINKIVGSTAEAVANIGDGATVMVGGFGTAGMPAELVDALIAQGARNLTIVSNNAGNAETGLAALIKALRGDRWGNLVYRKTARNFGPIMASAAKCTIAQVREIVNLGDLDPENVVTPGIFVQRIVEIPAATRLMATPGAAA